MRCPKCKSKHLQWSGDTTTKCLDCFEHFPDDDVDTTYPLGDIIHDLRNMQSMTHGAVELESGERILRQVVTSVNERLKTLIDRLERDREAGHK